MKIEITDKAVLIPFTADKHRLLGRNTRSSTIYFGFSEAVVGDDDTAQGIPIEAGEIFKYDGRDKYPQPLYLICATGENSTFNYDIQ